MKPVPKAFKTSKKLIRLINHLRSFGAYQLDINLVNQSNLGKLQTNLQDDHDNGRKPSPPANMYRPLANICTHWQTFSPTGKHLHPPAN